MEENKSYTLFGPYQPQKVWYGSKPIAYLPDDLLCSPGIATSEICEKYVDYEDEYYYRYTIIQIFRGVLIEDRKTEDFKNAFLKKLQIFYNLAYNESISESSKINAINHIYRYCNVVLNFMMKYYPSIMIRMYIKSFKELKYLNEFILKTQKNNLILKAKKSRIYIFLFQISMHRQLLNKFPTFLLKMSSEIVNPLLFIYYKQIINSNCFRPYITGEMLLPQWIEEDIALFINQERYYYWNNIWFVLLKLICREIKISLPLELYHFIMLFIDIEYIPILNILEFYNINKGKINTEKCKENKKLYRTFLFIE